MNKIIGFAGGMGVGKSTSIDILKRIVFSRCVNVKFAQPLYDIQEYAYTRINNAYTRPSDFVKDRKLLQFLGTEWLRDSIGGDVLGQLWENTVLMETTATPGAVITCDDVRFDDEAEHIKSLGGIIIKLISDKAQSRITTANGIPSHKSEVGLSTHLIDYVVDNNGTLKNLQDSLVPIYRKIFWNTTNDSSQ